MMNNTPIISDKVPPNVPALPTKESRPLPFLNATCTSIHHPHYGGRLKADEVVNLEVGQSAPDFEAELTDGTTMRLSEIIAAGEKVILYFYPKDSTPGCTTQACDFRDNFAKFSSAGYRVIGVS